jgi:thiol-disulfide isomerase/thioredoxin
LLKRWSALVAALVIVGMIVYQNVSEKPANQAQQVEQIPKIGFKAPEFSLKSLEGQAYAIPTTDKKPVVVNFWASWCGPCREEAPELVKIYKKYNGKIELYAVNLTLQDTVGDARAFADSYGYTFPVLLDDNQKNTISDIYKVLAIPTTFFIDSNGIIVDKVMGYTDPKTLENKFANLLK